ncbi:hypothetical protein TSUD_209380 [Trifolium subterraneum]|uniref:Ribosomal RNA small subunit methyltransferase G n=1 Tax=Trifolium subterraneum TaxID=3900 RepID=A0A2Z6P3V2_TRISU|nr:hypothetical protein TSUD_209380 [Trifolium subterraneum]
MVVLFNLQFSRWTFYKHLTPRKFTTLCHHNSTANLSHFVTLTSRQKDQIHLYVDTLLQWNKRMNLTAVKEVNEVMERHIEDSLAILPPLSKHYINHCSGNSIDKLKLVDVGTGAGLPGVVLAIARPGQSLGQNLCFREKFDIAVARAVAETRILAEYCLPLVRVGGMFIAAKGHDPEDEVKKAESAIKKMGASLLQVCSVESQSPYGQRTAVICLKDHPTPMKYPRGPGTPAKEPL